MREFAVVDADGNLIRIGSRIGEGSAADAGSG
jgi:hypothetical protein